MKSFYKVLVGVTVILLLSAGSLLGQEQRNEMLMAYQRNFARGSLSTKVQVLQDASEMEEGTMGELYLQAVEFYLSNFRTLSEDATAQELVKLAARLCGRDGYLPATESLWNLFRRSEETEVQVAAMAALGKLLEPGHELLPEIYRYLQGQTGDYAGGEEVDIQVLSETVSSLGKVGDPGAFPVIFSIRMGGYGEVLQQRSEDAINSLQGELTDAVLTVLREGSLEEKQAVLDWSMEREGFSRQQRGEIAQQALQEGLARGREEEGGRELRFQAVRYLTDLKWTAASSLLIRHFDITNIEVDRGEAAKSNLLEAIAALGVMGSHEAAVRLSLYIEVLNTYMENGQGVDEQVVLAVIHGLGELEDDVAFDSLLYAMYLDYPRSVKQAAREVLSELKD
ncbi:MAG TPA: hypothetical protein ENN41_06595 [Sediminispirochaeta sp.]|nr:hypothetical protein [Sediminispirochaeta sp.]